MRPEPEQPVCDVVSERENKVAIQPVPPAEPTPVTEPAHEGDSEKKD